MEIVGFDAFVITLDSGGFSTQGVECNDKTEALGRNVIRRCGMLYGVFAV